MLDRFLRIILMILIFPSAAGSAEVVKLYDYHRFPPFLTDQGQGLTRDFADYLSKLSGGAYSVQVEILPRNRFNIAIAEEKGPFLSPWLMPDWLGDAGMTKYQWGNVLMHDSDDLLSPASEPLDYSGPESLVGKKLGIVLGYQYPIIDQYLNSGKIERVSFGEEDQIVMMIAYERMKVGIIPGTAARYYASLAKFQGLLHISARPLYTYDRRVLMQGDAAWLKFLRQAVNNAPRDPNWQVVLRHYGLS